MDGQVTTPALLEVMALPARWRAFAESLSKQHYPTFAQICTRDAVLDCAEQLEAALQAPADPAIGKVAETVAAVIAAHFDQPPAEDKGPWSVGTDPDGKTFIQSDDFTHDVRLYVNGDFASEAQRIGYAKLIAQRLNPTVASLVVHSGDVLGVLDSSDAGSWDEVRQRFEQVTGHFGGEE